MKRVVPDCVIGPRSYGRRRGKRLSKRRLALLDTLLPQIVIPRLENGIDPWALFPVRPRALWLEIGFGGGEHLVAQASRNPDVGFIGCEVFLNGIASTLAHISTRNLANVRLFTDDVRLLLRALPDTCLERIFLLFPDPWPKKRHIHRRLVSPANLEHLARLLYDGCELRIASDDRVYLRWTLGLVPVHPAFHWLARAPDDWRYPPADWVTTRYEAKALRAGRCSFYLCFERKPRLSLKEL
ncbi:tRNA (guanine46-N7-)-methyltransferase [invertebrate metagenome]|uniref:tRNA (guanine(46)-N(7))-methyltransferase n=1 Tax=invertebrate metagenome TaxID=1711999 RepID=A0A484H6X0_9ZZZZ